MDQEKTQKKAAIKIFIRRADIVAFFQFYVLHRTAHMDGSRLQFASMLVDEETY